MLHCCPMSDIIIVSYTFQVYSGFQVYTRVTMVPCSLTVVSRSFLLVSVSRTSLLSVTPAWPAEEVSISLSLIAVMFL